MADIDLLKEARLFQSDDPELRRRLALIRPRLRPLVAGETIYEPGDPADCIYLLAGARDGQGGAEPLVQVRLAREASERSVRFVRVVRGDIFGETELLTAGLDPRPGKRTTSARALTAARVFGIPWSDLSELLQLDPTVRARFLRQASRRLMEAVWAQHSHGREDPDVVLADWLVELAADFGVTASRNRVSFPRKLSQADIAEEIGVSRETISRRLKEWERSGLVVSSAAGLEISDYERLVRIGGLQAGRDRAALSHAVADVAARIDSGDLVDARNIAADMLRYFPSSPELLHLMALAAARSGDREDAIAILRGARLTPDGDLEALKGRVARALKNPFAATERIAADDWIEDAFEDDADEPGDIADTRLVERLTADLAALEARLLKDRAFDAATPDAQVAAESGRAYEAIWRRLGSWYAGVNAASMALAAGNIKQAQKLAGEVLKRVGDGPKQYWAAATAAEALLVSGDKKQGISMLSEATLKADATDANKASTALQLSRLAPQLGLSMDQVRAALSVKSVAVVTGHMFRAAEMDAAQQNEASATIRAAAETIFREHNVGNVFGALACGTDLVVAEAALDAGIPFHAVAPFPLPRYVELSVAIGDPDGDAGHWERRFDDVLQRAASLTLVDDELPLDRDLDGHFYYGFRFMAGLALMRAEALQAECRLIAVTDGTDAVNVAGSSQAAADWLAAGRPLDAIAFDFKRKAPAGRARGATSFRPVVFLWDTTGGRADSQALKKAGVAKKKDFAVVERMSRVGGAGTAVVAPSFEDALALAETCAAAGGKRDAAALRVICDFGPVLGADLKPDEKMIARLKAGSDMPGFPPGRVLATQSFAAQARAALGERLAAFAVGRTEESRDGEAARLRHRPGLPVYRVSLRSPE